MYIFACFSVVFFSRVAALCACNAFALACIAENSRGCVASKRVMVFGVITMLAGSVLSFLVFAAVRARLRVSSLFGSVLLIAIFLLNLIVNVFMPIFIQKDHTLNFFHPLRLVSTYSLNFFCPLPCIEDHSLNFFCPSAFMRIHALNFPTSGVEMVFQVYNSSFQMY